MLFAFLLFITAVCAAPTKNSADSPAAQSIHTIPDANKKSLQIPTKQEGVEKANSTASKDVVKNKKEKVKSSGSIKKAIMCPLNVIVDRQNCHEELANLPEETDGKYEKIQEMICKCRTTVQIVTQAQGTLVATALVDSNVKQTVKTPTGGDKAQLAHSGEEQVSIKYSDFMKNLSPEEKEAMKEYLEETWAGEKINEGSEELTIVVKM